MKIYSKYKDYQEYVDIQTETNKAKIDVVWVSEIEVEYICNYVQSLPLSLAHKSNMYSDEMYNVMCHGARNGTEVTFFEKTCPRPDIAKTTEDTPANRDAIPPNKTGLIVTK